MATELKEKKRWLFFGLPFTFTTYTVKENVLTVNSGFLKKVESDCYSTLFERMFGLGTVICYTGDTTDPKLPLTHIKNARAVKDFILEMSEAARLKRRTVNTLNIGADVTDLDGDGIPD